MNRRLVVAGAAMLVLYLVLVISRFPAGTAIAWFAPPELRLLGVSGTVWNGSAQAVSTSPVRFGQSTWEFLSLSLFGPAISYRVELNRPDGFVRGDITLGAGGVVSATDLVFDLQLGSMPELLAQLQVPPDGFHGRVTGRIDHLVMEQGWPTSLSGLVNLENLVVTYVQTVELGTYQVTFSGGDTIIGTIEDADAPLDLQGATLVLGADRSYEFDGLIATTSKTSDVIRQTLPFFGQQDAQGRFRFNRSGALQ